MTLGAQSATELQTPSRRASEGVRRVGYRECVGTCRRQRRLEGMEDRERFARTLAALCGRLRVRQRRTIASSETGGGFEFSERGALSSASDVASKNIPRRPEMFADRHLLDCKRKILVGIEPYCDIHAPHRMRLLGPRQKS